MDTNKLVFAEFEERFKTDHQCFDYLFALRWPNGYHCPRCNYHKSWEVSPYKYKCRHCGYQTTVTACTFFHHTHVSILKWFKAIWYMSKKGHSATAKELQALLKIGSNRTAQSMIKQIQAMMFTMDEELINRKLAGTVDFTAKPIKRQANSPYLFIAAEINNQKTGHIKIEYVPRCSQECFRDFIETNVEHGSFLQKDSGSWKLSLNSMSDFQFSSQHWVDYKAPFANKIYKDFCYYFSQQTSKNLSSIIKEYTQMVNRQTDDITFDDLLHNIMSDDSPIE